MKESIMKSPQPLQRLLGLCGAILVAAAFGGCGRSEPEFILAWSEYPSWSVFGVAHEQRLINGDPDKLGPIEEKWGVDIVLKEVDYDTCITMYGTASCDAVCITNMDILAPSLGRESVAILPTSTSVGADACVVVGVANVQQLRNYKVYGLEKSVSEYCFVRNLELLGEKEADHKFTNMDPAQAAASMQSDQATAIMVWNPFVLQTLKMNENARVLFDSSTIPGEIVDMVVMGRESLEKPGGPDFACAVIDAFYAISDRLEDPASAEKTLVALGAKFSSLDVEDMKKVVQQTRFYKTTDEGFGLFTSADLQKIMRTVLDFCLNHEIVSKEPIVGYGDSTVGDANLRFDPSFIKLVADKR